MPQDPPLPPVFASTPITRLKSQKAPKGEVFSVTHEEAHYSPTELLEFSDSYRGLMSILGHAFYECEIMVEKYTPRSG